MRKASRCWRVMMRRRPTLKVGEPSVAHLVVEQIPGQAGDLRGLVDGIGEPLASRTRSGVGHPMPPFGVLACVPLADQRLVGQLTRRVGDEPVAVDAVVAGLRLFGGRSARPLCGRLLHRPRRIRGWTAAAGARHTDD